MYGKVEGGLIQFHPAKFKLVLIVIPLNENDVELGLKLVKVPV